MKRLIFFVMVLCSTVFSAENIQINWKNDLKEIGTHGNYKAEWTKKVLMPGGCSKGVEQRLDEIVLVSVNILEKKPSEWLNGKYLEYVNSSCDIWDSLKGTPTSFEKRVDNFNNLKSKKETISTKSDSSGVIVIAMALFGLIYFKLIRLKLWSK